MAIENEKIVEEFFDGDHELRDFDEREPYLYPDGEPLIAGFVMDDPIGSDAWVVSVVYEHGNYDDPVLEFYDANDTRVRPFVSAYNFSVLDEHDRRCGLDLYGGVPSWSISADDLQDIIAWFFGAL